MVDYFNAARQAEDRTVFETDLMELKTLLESGMDISELDEQSQKKVSKYMSIRNWGNKTTVSTRHAGKPISIMDISLWSRIERRSALSVSENIADVKRSSHFLNQANSMRMVHTLAYGGQIRYGAGCLFSLCLYATMNI